MVKNLFASKEDIKRKKRNFPKPSVEPVGNWEIRKALQFFEVRKSRIFGRLMTDKINPESKPHRPS